LNLNRAKTTSRHLVLTEIFLRTNSFYSIGSGLAPSTSDVLLSNIYQINLGQSREHKLLPLTCVCVFVCVCVCERESVCAENTSEILSFFVAEDINMH